MRTVDAGGTPCAFLVDCGNQIASGIAHDAAGAMLSFLASSLVSGAAWIVERAVALVFSVTQPDLGASWFVAMERPMVAIAKYVLVPLLAAATIGPVLRQDLRALARVWTVGLPVAVMAGLGASLLTDTALALTDELCSDIASGGGGVSANLTKAFETGVVPGAPTAVAVLAGAALLAGGLLLWLELAVRSAAIYIAVFFAPLALAAFVWPATMALAKRTAQLIVALVLSKFVIVAALVLGVSALGAGDSHGSGLIGVAIILMAAAAPFSLLRLVPIVEVAAIAHLEGMSRRPVRAVQHAASAVGGSAPITKTLLARSSAARNHMRPSAVTPRPIADRAPDYVPEPANRGDGDG